MVREAPPELKLEEKAVQLLRALPRRGERRWYWKVFHPRLMALFSVILLWHLSSVVTERIVGDPVLPYPHVVFRVTIFDTILDEDFFIHLGNTLFRIVVGFGLSFITGMAMGIVMGVHRYWEAFFSDYVVIGLTIPSLAWAVIGVLWFGIKPMTPIFATLMITFPYIAINIWEGVKAVDKDLVDMARAFQVPRQKIIRQIYIPSLMPFLFASIRFGFAIAWKIVILAEVFGANNGIGYMIFYWFGLFNMRQVLAWVVIFTVLMLLIEYGLIRKAEQKVLAWRPEAIL